DRPADVDEREWDIDVAPSPASTARLSVVVRLPTTGTVALPEVWCRVGGSAPEPGGVVNWLGVTGGRRGLRLEGATAADGSVTRAGGPGEAERLGRAGGSAWAIAPGTSPALVFEAAPTAAPKAAAPATVRPAENPAPADGIETSLPLLPAAAWC